MATKIFKDDAPPPMMPYLVPLLPRFLCTLFMLSKRFLSLEKKYHYKQNILGNKPFQRKENYLYDETPTVSSEVSAHLKQFNIVLYQHPLFYQCLSGPPWCHSLQSALTKNLEMLNSLSSAIATSTTAHLSSYQSQTQ